MKTGIAPKKTTLLQGVSLKVSKSKCLLKIYKMRKARGCARGFVANFWTFILWPLKIYFTLIRSEGRRPKLLVVFFRYTEQEQVIYTATGAVDYTYIWCYQKH